MPVYTEHRISPSPRLRRAMPEKVIDMHLRIPLSEYEAMKRFAHSRGMALTLFMRRLIQTYCKQQLEKEQRLLRARQIQEANEK